jgi:hypothetical protein
VCARADFSFTFGGKPFVWCAYQREQINEFFFCCLEICRQTFRATPQVLCTVAFVVVDVGFCFVVLISGSC